MTRRPSPMTCSAALLSLLLLLGITAPGAFPDEPEPPEVEEAEPEEPKEAEPEAPKPEPPKPTLEGARDAIACGRYDDGLKALEAALAKAEGQVVQDLRALRVRAHLETGKYAEAVAEAAELQKLAAKDPDVLALHAEALLETGQYAEAGKRLAQALEASPDHVRARLLSLVLAEITGNKAAAEAQVDYFFRLYNQDKAKTAEALAAVARAVEDEDPHGAWRAYREAMKADPKHIDACLLAGFHTASKYAWQFARENFDKALKINPHCAVAHAGLASVCLANNQYGKAQASIEAALKVNPNLALARQIKASMLAVEQKNDESLAEIQAAMKVNPSDPRTLSLLAAHHEALGHTAERDKVIAQVLQINPRYADVYATLSLACERLRRSPAAIAWGRKAIELRPDYWHGYYLAGMNLLRSGEEAEGYKLVERAFDLNRFNIWACNTLTVLDRDLKKKEFVYHETPHFLVKLDKSEDAILWPYLEPMLEPMYEALTEQYRFEPKGPAQYGGKILVLLYPKHEEFSARTIGLPGLSALGACLGQVITMPSPGIAGRRRGGAFNWRQVLLHEFSHVVTLQKTDYNIPRWLTEGISVWEEDDTRVKWDQLLAAGLHNNKLLPLEDLNTGFVRPKFPTQVPLCYYHAFLIIRHFDATYGADAIVKLLDGYRASAQTAKLLPEVTGKTMEQLNQETLAYVRDYARPIRYSPPISKKELDKLEEEVKKNDKDADLWTQLARGRLMRRNKDGAVEAANKAIGLDPKLARPHGVLGFIAYRFDKQPDKAKDHYQKAKSLDPDYFPARLYLGLIAQEQGDTMSALTELEAARKLAPRYVAGKDNPYERLAELYVKTRKPDQAIAVLRDLVQLDSNDAAARLRLAELLADQDKHAEAAAACLDAVHIDPYDLKTHLTAAKAYEAAKALPEAIREYRVALAIEPTDLAALVGHARTLAASGQTAAAREAVGAIRKVDPDNLEAAEIERSLDR